MFIFIQRSTMLTAVVALAFGLVARPAKVLA